jgi:hypothetical protein
MLRLERVVLRNEIESKYPVWTYILIQLFTLIELDFEYCRGVLSKRECRWTSDCFRRLNESSGDMQFKIHLIIRGFRIFRKVFAVNRQI